SSDVMARILDRLDALERQNQDLLNEVHVLREEIKASHADASSQKQEEIEERLDVSEKRIKEQAQTKVETSQRFPITLSGMLLFDAFFDSKEPPIYGQPEANRVYGGVGGATLRQSILGLDF